MAKPLQERTPAEGLLGVKEGGGGLAVANASSGLETGCRRSSS